jgi:2-iminobutanoate/2-iminopropanoate deaminase
MKQILSKAAPTPVGPYSQAIVHGGVAYLSGQVALDPATGKLRGDSIEEQTEQVLANLREVLRAAGSDFDQVLRVGVYLTNMQDFPRFNEIYGRAMGAARPARSTIQVAALPLGARIEIDCVAVVAG